MAEWKAQPGPQTLALQIPDSVNEILYGGQRGGGKTDTGMVWMQEPIEVPRYRGLVIRKHASDLRDWVDRAMRMYQGLGVKQAYRPWELSFPSGAKIYTGHLKDDLSYTQWMGQEFQRMLIEELTQIPDEKRYSQLRASNRSTIPGLRAQTFATTNPGGVGHAWVRKRFVDPAPYYQIFYDRLGLRRVYIPAGIDNNPALTKNDPDYVKQLESLKEVDYDLWKAWRLGDWSIVAGQAFREWNPLMHISPVPPISLRDCKKFVCFDWGYSAWGVALWVAIAPENQYGVVRYYVYREMWMQKQEPREWARQFKLTQRIDGVKDIWLPHDCFNKEMGDSIADIFHRDGGMNVKQAATLQTNARHMRKAIMHASLADAIDGRPYLQMHPNCSMLAASIPELITDENDPEDIDTDGNDHGYDALTEGLMMEAPHLAKSGGIRTDRLLPQIKRNKIWSPGLMPGTYNAPDIMSAIAEYNTRPHHVLRPR